MGDSEMPELIETKAEVEPVPAVTTKELPGTAEVAKEPPVSNVVPEEVPVANGVTEESPVTNGVPEKVPVANGVPEVPVTNGVHEEVPVTNGVPEEVPVTNGVPEVPETNGVPEDIPVPNAVPDVVENVPVVPVPATTDVTDAVTDAVTEAVPVPDAVAETVPVTDVVAEAVPVTDAVAKDVPVTDAVAVPVTDAVAEAVPVTDAVPETVPVTDAIPEAVPVTDAVADAGPVTEVAEETPSTKAVAKEESPVKSPRATVYGVVAKLKNDTTMSDSDKIDTLCLLVQRIVEENSSLKGEIAIVIEQCEKQKEAKEAIKTLNEAYKRQIDLVREESKLRLEEEQAKRQAGMGGYTDTMTDLSKLLETHTEQNSRLREQNTDMAERMGQLIGESEKRDEFITHCQTEAQLQITLLQHQVQKAQIEKAEVKADLTKERLAISQELLLERERSSNLEDTVRILKEQGDIYQAQMEELQTGAGQSTKSFQHFKTQIEKLTSAMGQLEKDTAQWRQKYEVSSGQVKKMNTASMERENEVTALKKKLDSMVKLNKTLSAERAALLEKVKQAA